MWSYLISDIALLSNHKSFSLGVDTTRNLWLLLHFKELEIKNKTIIYQVDNGIRQRKNTNHPIRKMRKTYKNTAELLEYLSDKPYVIRQLELEFTNGWKIKQRPYIELLFYTNSTQERNQLIDKLLRIAGQGPIDISKLKVNYFYYFKSALKLIKINVDNLPLPDEFWSEKQLNNWKKDYDKINEVYENEQLEELQFNNLDKDSENFEDFNFLNKENLNPF